MSQTPSEGAAAPVQVCIVTGLSGAGKSTALRVFEDLRYFTVDGLPAGLAVEMVEMMRRGSMERFRGMALGMDMRQQDFLEELNVTLAQLSEHGVRPILLFLEAGAQELMRRYATTRRPHPLEREGMGLEDALHEERTRLAPVREMADLVIDTSRFSIHDLRRAIQKRWSRTSGKLRAIRVNVISFGFKYGVPREADFVFDLRFLPNPYFVEKLRPLSGKDKAVRDYVFASEAAQEFEKKLFDLVRFMLPQMEAEGRYRVAIAVGCTGGRHRSVATAEALFQMLRQADYPASIEHSTLNLARKAGTLGLTAAFCRNFSSSARYVMSEQQSSTQVGIIVVAHADYGSAMLRTAEFILGTLSDCTSISVDIAQEVPETVRRLDDAAQRLDKGAGVIILTDMFGGTPTNLALSLLGSHNVEVVTGVNLPMLLKVFTCREKPLAELAKLAGEAGTKGIVVAGSMLRSRNKEKTGD